MARCMRSIRKRETKSQGRRPVGKQSRSICQTGRGLPHAGSVQTSEKHLEPLLTGPRHRNCPPRPIQGVFVPGQSLPGRHLRA